MTNIDTVRIRVIADWLDGLHPVVTTHPEIEDDLVRFHLTHAEDWREQARAILEGAEDVSHQAVTNFASIDATHPDFGKLDLFVPLYEDDVTSERPRVDLSEFVR